MTSSPTRATLLLRIRDASDDHSWAEFVEIYTPILFGFCLRRGLSHPDAADIVQDVMRGIAGAIARFEYDPERGTFRSWLFTVARHEVGRFHRSQSRRPIPVGSASTVVALDETPSDSDETDWELDYRRQLLAWASDKIRPEFSDPIWEAFERTSLGDEDPTRVGQALGMTRAAVYIAKSRVVRRLREKIASVAAEEWELDAMR